MTSRAPSVPLTLASALRSVIGSIACRGLYREGMAWIGRPRRQWLRERVETARASRRPRVPVAEPRTAEVSEDVASRIQGIRASIREAERFLSEGEDAP